MLSARIQKVPESFRLVLFPVHDLRIFVVLFLFPVFLRNRRRIPPPFPFEAEFLNQHRRDLDALVLREELFHRAFKNRHRSGRQNGRGVSPSSCRLFVHSGHCRKFGILSGRRSVPRSFRPALPHSSDSPSDRCRLIGLGLGEANQET